MERKAVNLTNGQLTRDDDGIFIYIDEDGVVYPSEYALLWNNSIELLEAFRQLDQEETNTDNSPSQE